MTNQQEYTPFGEEWKKEVSKMRKAEIIDMLATVLHERDLLRKVRAVKQPSALDLIAAEREKQKITSINISITAPGGDVLYSTANNAMFSTVTQALRDFKKDLKHSIAEDPERFKNVII